MKDCAGFLKWLHKKGIPFREGMNKIRIANSMSTNFFKPLIDSHWVLFDFLGSHMSVGSRGILISLKALSLTPICQIDADVDLQQKNLQGDAFKKEWHWNAIITQSGKPNLGISPGEISRW
jgi:hypothetical protein